MIYNVDFDLAAVVISLMSILFVVLKKSVEKRQNKILMLLLAMCTLSSIFDITSSIGNSYVESWSFFRRDIHNYIYLLLQNLMSYVVACYVVAFSGADLQYKSRKTFHFFLVLPTLVLTLVLFSNLFTRLVFYYDADKIYTHGPMFVIMNLISYGYLIISFYFLIRYRNNVSRDKQVVFCGYIIGMVVAVILQLIFSHVLLVLFLCSLSLLGLVLIVDNDDAVRDSVSGVYNRKSFMEDFALYLDRTDSFEMILVRPDLGKMASAGLNSKMTYQLCKEIGTFFKGFSEHVDAYYVENGYYVLLGRDANSLEPDYEVLVKRLDTPWSVAGRQIAISAQSMLLRIPEDVQSMEELLAVIDIRGVDTEALSGRTVGGFVNNTAENERENVISVTNSYRRETAVLEALERAISRNTVQVYVEPIWNAERNSIAGGEIRISLEDEILGKVSGRELMQAAEKNGLSSSITEMVMRKSCELAARPEFEKAGLRFLHINMRGDCLQDLTMLDICRNLVKEYGIDPGVIGFELDGKSLLHLHEQNLRILYSYKEAGFHIVVDNFGVDYSDLMGLAKLPLDGVKYDRTILEQMLQNARVNTVVKTTMRMAERLSLLCMATGIDDKERKNLMQDMGCQYLQGLYFQDAITAGEFLHYCNGFNMR